MILSDIIANVFPERNIPSSVRYREGVIDSVNVLRICGRPEVVETRLLVVFVKEGSEQPSRGLGEQLYPIVRRHMDHASFVAKKGKSLLIPIPDAPEGVRVGNVLLVCLGNGAYVDDLRSRTAETVRRARALKIDEMTILLPDEPDEATSCAVAEGAVLGSYVFERYISRNGDERPQPVRQVGICDGNEAGISRGVVLAESQVFARDLVNEPANVVTPVTMAETADATAREFGLECQVWDESRLERERMNALLAVGRGSAVPPRFVHLAYRPVRCAPGCRVPRVAIVGKGLTYDSGGLNIKTGDSMRTMKGDKTGACDVLGVMRGVARLAPAVEVHGIFGAAENMPDGGAFKPDDIVRARNGKTIEIDNTDAEGRVTLADSLSYASELAPDAIIDIATLTGSCAVALGNWTAGLFPGDETLARDIEAAAKRSGERLWRMPMDDEKLREAIKSPVADVLNSGTRYGGAICAAMFLQSFVAEGIAWAHLDIAGVDMYKEETGIYGKGASAWGVRLCLEYIRSLAEGTEA
jgi:leucyl aminopeptidase